MGDMADYYGSGEYPLDGLVKTTKKNTRRRIFVQFENGVFYWLDKTYKKHDITKMEDTHLFNSIQFLYDWAGQKKEDRNLELSILAHEERRRDLLKETDAGKLLYVT